MVSYFSSSLGLLYMAKLKQLGGCFALVGKKMEQHPLYQEQTMYLQEMETVELMLMNNRNIRLYNAQDRDIIEKVNTYGCFVEWCNSMIEFLILTKHDFERERLLKINMFGKVFENHDCQELTSFFLNAVTLGQTFNDDFTMIMNLVFLLVNGKQIWKDMLK